MQIDTYICKYSVKKEGIPEIKPAIYMREGFFNKIDSWARDNHYRFSIHGCMAEDLPEKLKLEIMFWKNSTNKDKSVLFGIIGKKKTKRNKNWSNREYVLLNNKEIYTLYKYITKTNITIEEMNKDIFSLDTSVAYIHLVGLEDRYPDFTRDILSFKDVRCKIFAKTKRINKGSLYFFIPYRYQYGNKFKSAVEGFASMLVDILVLNKPKIKKEHKFIYSIRFDINNLTKLVWNIKACLKIQNKYNLLDLLNNN